MLFKASLPFTNHDSSGKTIIAWPFRIRKQSFMLMEQATNVRKQWSSVCDSVIHDKPKFIKRTRDKMRF